MAKEFDFVAIGDITTDAFIRLSGDDATIEREGNRKQKICFNFGDKIEYDKLVEVAAVGNSPNAAVAAKRLGLSSALIAHTGDDYHGKTQLAQLKKEGVATDFVKIHKGAESNYHFVLWYEEERTILVRHHKWPYEMPDIGVPKWMYLSSLGEHSIPFHHAIADYIKAHPRIKLTFQPGTFQIRLGYETLKDVYTQTELFFCNREEAKLILKTEERDVKKLLSGIRDLGPKIVVITDGPEGAYSYDGEETWHIPMYPDPKPPVDRTGAGDSFASTFTSLLAIGRSIPEALKLAPVNSMSVVQYVGAQEGLLPLSELEAWLAKAPKEYTPTKL
ncbi:MAG: carbohydrate kinase family protein [Parcubacteria group bacterium]|nr:carbohydrate kinase family protein [Parcubacteria group bacterium]